MSSPRTLEEWMRQVERDLKIALRGGVTKIYERFGVVEETIDTVVTDIESGSLTDTRTPAAPTTFTWQTSLYLDRLNREYGTISVDFAAVTLATNATPISIDAYELWGRDETGWDGITDPPPWLLLATGASPSLMAASLAPGSTWRVRVRAMAEGLIHPGLWGGESVQVVSTDTTPPPQPSTPVLTSILGVVHVRWDGLSSAAAAMPADFSHVEIAMGTTSSPTTLTGHRLGGAGSATFPALPLGTLQYVRLRAVDYSGNLSGWSVQASITPQPLVQTDVLDLVSDLDYAQATADGKNRITWSASAATLPYTGTIGDVWFQRNGSGQIIGQWEWDGAAWTSRPIENALIASLDAGKITTGFIDAARIDVGSLAANKVVIAGDNYVDNGRFVNGASVGWSAGDGTVVADATAPGGYLLRFAGTGGYPTRMQQRILPARAGEQFVLAGLGRRSSTAGAVAGALAVQWLNSAGSVISESEANMNATAANTWFSFTADATAPAGTVALRIYLMAKPTAPGGSTVDLADLRVLIKASGELIVDGAITAQKIAANAVEAAKIAAGAVQAQHINVGAVRPTGLGFGVDELAANPMWSSTEMRTFYPPPAGWSYDTTAGHLQDGQTHVVLMPPSAAGPTMAKSYLTSVNSTASQTTYTFTGVTLGAADATRSIILIGASRGTLGNTSVTVTVAGISATVDVFAGFEGTNNCVWVARAEVPTGTSGTIVVTNSAAQLRTNVAVYRVVGSYLRKVDSAWAQDFGTAPTGLTVGPGGSALVFAGIYAAWNGASFTWSGDVVEDFDFSFDTYARVGGASGLNAADVTVTAATNDINKAVSVAYVPTQDTTTSMDLAQALRVAPGDKFFVRMVAKQVTAATWLPRLSLGCADADGDPVVSPYVEGDSAVPVGSYAPYEGILTVPDGAFTIAPKLLAAAGTGNWAVRAVSIRRVLSSENAIGQSVEISPQGFILRGPNDDGDPDITLGTNGTPSLVLRDEDDNPSVSIDSSGAVLANGIYAMQGLWYKGTELTDVIRQMPRGLVALGEQYFSTAGITTEYGIMEIAFESEIDRSYRVDWQMIAIGSTGTTEMGNYIRYTTDGSKPTLSSPYIRYQVQKLGAATAWETARDFFLWFPHHTGTIRLLLTAIGVNGNVSLANYQPVQFNVYDTGTTWTNVGVVNTGAAGSTSPVMRRTTERATEWAMDYETDNSTYNVDPTRLYVGRLDAASPYTKSLMGFPDAMRTDLTGATAIHDIWVRLRNLHWYRATGGTAVLGRHVWDSQPGTATWDADALVVPMTYGQDLWVRLPDAWYNSFKTGGGKFGVALYAPTDSLDYYGYFDRGVTGQVRYRYTK